MLVRDSLYSVNYFSKDTVLIIGIVYGIFLISALAGAFIFYFRTPPKEWHRYYLATAYLFLMSCLVMILQHYILDSNYLLNRKALVFIPLSALLTFFLLYGLAEISRQRLAMTLSVLLTVSMFYHSIRAFNFSHCREWWYDKNTRSMVEYLEARIPPGSEAVQLGTSWVFQPSALFYIEMWGISEIVHPPSHGEILTDGRYDYYYVFDGEIPQLEEKYVHERAFPWGKSLLKRKDIE